MTGARALRTIGWLLLAALAALIVFAGVWRLQGGRIERVETPSMGTVAPVGSLLWVERVSASSLRVGDFITFHPPGRPGTTFSHQVHKIHADGSIGTKGEISAADPWRLHQGDLVGRVAMTWPVAGWFVLLGPVLAAGGFLVALVAGRLRSRWRGVAVLVGASIVLAVATVVYRPFIGADQLAFKEVQHGARATYVSTGLLPVRLRAEPGGAHVDLGSGEVGSVAVPDPTSENRYAVRLSPAVPPLFWIVLVGACFVPAIANTGVRVVRRLRGHPPTPA